MKNTIRNRAQRTALAIGIAATTLALSTASTFAAAAADADVTAILADNALTYTAAKNGALVVLGGLIAITLGRRVWSRIAK